MEGDIDCSQAEGALCGAWWWALRTPGLSLLSGPEEEQTHISLRIGDLCKCVCNCMSFFFHFHIQRPHVIQQIPSDSFQQMHTFSLLLFSPPIKAQKIRLAGQAIHLKSPCNYSQNMPLGKPYAGIAPLTMSVMHKS